MIQYDVTSVQMYTVVQLQQLEQLRHIVSICIHKHKSMAQVLAC